MGRKTKQVENKYSAQPLLAALQRAMCLRPAASAAPPRGADGVEAHMLVEE